MKFQLPLVLGLALVAGVLLVAAAFAPAQALAKLEAQARMSGAFAVVTYTPNQPGISPWVDSGWIVADHEYRDPNDIGGKEYTYRFLEFTDHVNEYHLDDGRVDVVYQ